MFLFLISIITTIILPFFKSFILFSLYFILFYFGISVLQSIFIFPLASFYSISTLPLCQHSLSHFSPFVVLFLLPYFCFRYSLFFLFTPLKIHPTYISNFHSSAPSPYTLLFLHYPNFFSLPFFLFYVFVLLFCPSFSLSYCCFFDC
uniref:Uncharacterized protein n=1 Tax=Myotis myotis TaxID=51298 RepID=A0A7J7RMD2_MYOMY|nr:hypothetical protein mMyoMyo1_010282 [Myotis myotis]